METKKCLKCGFNWVPRKENPIACPNCKNRKWNVNVTTMEVDVNANREKISDSI
jgi:predicted Zn-ribbon and HTH transcriptional regulator